MIMQRSKYLYNFRNLVNCVNSTENCLTTNIDMLNLKVHKHFDDIFVLSHSSIYNLFDLKINLPAIALYANSPGMYAIKPTKVNSNANAIDVS